MNLVNSGGAFVVGSIGCPPLANNKFIRGPYWVQLCGLFVDVGVTVEHRSDHRVSWQMLEQGPFRISLRTNVAGRKALSLNRTRNAVPEKGKRVYPFLKTDPFTSLHLSDEGDDGGETRSSLYSAVCPVRRGT